MAKNETKPRVPHVKSDLERAIDEKHKASQQPVKVLRKLARTLGTLTPERQREVLAELTELLGD